MKYLIFNFHIFSYFLTCSLWSKSINSHFDIQLYFLPALSLFLWGSLSPCVYLVLLLSYKKIFSTICLKSETWYRPWILCMALCSKMTEFANTVSVGGFPLAGQKRSLSSLLRFFVWCCRDGAEQGKGVGGGGDREGCLTKDDHISSLFSFDSSTYPQPILRSWALKSGGFISTESETVLTPVWRRWSHLFTVQIFSPFFFSKHPFPVAIRQLKQQSPRNWNFPQESCAQERKKLKPSLVPAWEGTCLLGRGCRNLWQLTRPPCQTDWKWDTDASVME